MAKALVAGKTMQATGRRHSRRAGKGAGVEGKRRVERTCAERWRGQEEERRGERARQGEERRREGKEERRDRWIRASKEGRGRGQKRWKTEGEG